MIITAAAALFRERGYRGTSIDDIGGAVGLTGPALYRHFASKEALLAELLERALDRARRDLDAAEAAGGGPRALLQRIVAAAVAQVADEGELVLVAAREIGHLGQEARTRIVRGQRGILDAWVEALRRVRPELGPPEARAAVLGVAALINAATRSGGPRAEARPELVRSMALGALLARS
jgi:AcrR family transcriptional regulator